MSKTLLSIEMSKPKYQRIVNEVRREKKNENGKTEE